MTKKTAIIANWKMNPKSAKEAEHLFKAVQKGVQKTEDLEIIVCPPFVWLPLLNSPKMKLGAQDCFWEKEGAYTGEISPAILKDLGCEYVIVGHSERRRFFKETDETVNKKIRAVLKARLKPILCVGEQARDAFDSSGRALNEMSLVVAEQLKKSLKEISSARLQDIVIAYEPIWAIGTGNPCTSDDAMKAGLFIRKTLVNLYHRQAAEKASILYGGSVNSKNAASYIKEAAVDGLLVGGASLNASEFIRIIKSISSLS